MLLPAFSAIEYFYIESKKQNRPMILKVKEICKRTNYAEDGNKVGANDALTERLNDDEGDCRPSSPALQTRRKKGKGKNMNEMKRDDFRLL